LYICHSNLIRQTGEARPVEEVRVDKVGLEDFEQLQVLGKGGFGMVIVKDIQVQL
jgi:hypothetical protein